MGTALSGVLAVYETVVFLAVLVDMRYRHFDVRALEVYDRIKRLLCKILFQEVFESVARDIGLAVEHYLEAGVEEGIVLQQRHNKLIAECIVAEYIRRGRESYHRTVCLLGRLYRALLHKLSERKTGPLALAVAERRYLETCRQRIHGLDTHTVETYSLCEGAFLELAAGIHLGSDIDNRTQWNTSSEVANGGGMLVDIDYDLVAIAHHVLVDRVVYNLLEQYIYAVVTVCSVAEFTDIHARPLLYVLIPRQRQNRAVVVAYSSLGLVVLFLRFGTENILIVIHWYLIERLLVWRCHTSVGPYSLSLAGRSFSECWRRSGLL